MIFAANFKTNHTRKSTESYIKELNEKLGVIGHKDKIYIFPPATALDSYECDFIIGAQNAYPAQSGAYTGEIGLEQLEEFGIKTILIGHSERRNNMQESQKKVVEKFAFFQEHGFEIIYCIGEPLDIREDGTGVVTEYLKGQLEGIDVEYENLIIAYEPIWAIGTGRSAEIEEISTTHKALKTIINNKTLLYGGSVNPTNIKDIINVEGVDGVLVGSSSLKADSFSKITLSQYKNKTTPKP